MSDGTCLESLSDSIDHHDLRYGKRLRLSDSPNNDNSKVNRNESPNGQGGLFRNNSKKIHAADSASDQNNSTRINRRFRVAESPANLQERIQNTQEERKRRQVS